MKLKTLTLFLILFSTSISFAFWGSPINIKLPEPIELSGFVPILIDLNKEVKNGDKLELYINNSLAMTIKPLSDVSLSRVSTRIRATENPTVADVKIRYADGSKDTGSASSSVESPYNVPSEGDSNKKYKLKAKNGKLRMLYLNNMGETSHLNRLELNTDKGLITVEFTPLMSGKDGSVYDSSFPESMRGRPMTGYFELEGNFNSAKLKASYSN